MDIFGSNVPGTANRIAVTGGVTASISFAVGGLFNDSSLLITSVGYSGKAALQFMRTLGKSVYVYNFGLRDTMVVVNGISFLLPCNGSGGSTALLSLVGKFEAAAAAGTAVAVSVGSLSFSGLVYSLRSTWSNPATGAMGFELQTHAISSRAASLLAGAP